MVFVIGQSFAAPLAIGKEIISHDNSVSHFPTHACIGWLNWHNSSPAVDLIRKVQKTVELLSSCSIVPYPHDVI